MLLAGDIGGTKTLLGLFEPGETRPVPRHVDEFVTLDYDGLETILLAFLARHGVSTRDLDAAAFGVAGAITDQVAQLTNVPWRIDAAALMQRGGFRRVRLLNDLEAMAYAIPVLSGDELAVLQEGTRIASGNIAVIAAGTGLGEGMLLNIEGRLVPGQSEGGHADFAARTPRELEWSRAPLVYGGSAPAHPSGPDWARHRSPTTPVTTRAGREPALGEPARRQSPYLHRRSRERSAGAAARSPLRARDRTCVGVSRRWRLFVSATARRRATSDSCVARLRLFGGGIAPRFSRRSATRFWTRPRKAPLDGGREDAVAVILNQIRLLGAAVHANRMVNVEKSAIRIPYLSPSA